MRGKGTFWDVKLSYTDKSTCVKIFYKKKRFNRFIFRISEQGVFEDIYKIKSKH